MLDYKHIGENFNRTHVKHKWRYNANVKCMNRDEKVYKVVTNVFHNRIKIKKYQ